MLAIQTMRTYDSVTDHELEGAIVMVPTEYCGRKSTVSSGYRGQFFWHINDEPCTDWLAETYFEGDQVAPGQTAKVKIKLAGTILEYAQKHGIQSGSQFALREGARIVAVGKITHSKYSDG